VLPLAHDMGDTAMKATLAAEIARLPHLSGPGETCCMAMSRAG
jgi:hypothetical protein